jgi:hypothetical protein
LRVPKRVFIFVETLNSKTMEKRKMKKTPKGLPSKWWEQGINSVTGWKHSADRIVNEEISRYYQTTEAI